MAIKKFQDEPEKTEPQTESAVMTGHPAENVPEETPPAAPPVREVTINGRKFSVDSDLAEQLAQRDRDFDRKLNDNSNELGRLRKLASEATSPTPPSPKGYDTLLFEDPVGAVNRIKEEIRQEYVKEKRLDMFWNKFYGQNKDLDRTEDDFIVKAILNDNLQTLTQLSEEEAASKLADLSRRQILKYQSKTKEDDTDNSRTRVETPSRSTVRSAPKADQGPTSLTDLIKQRRAQRAKTG